MLTMVVYNGQEFFVDHDEEKYITTISTTLTKDNIYDVLKLSWGTHTLKYSFNYAFVSYDNVNEEAETIIVNFLINGEFDTFGVLKFYEPKDNKTYLAAAKEIASILKENFDKKNKYKF